MKTAILLGEYLPKNIYSQIERGEIPRPEYCYVADALSAEIISYDDMSKSDRLAVRAARRIADYTGLAAYAFLRRHDFDHFYFTGEDVSMRFAAMMAAALDFGRTTTLVHNAKHFTTKARLKLIPSKVWRHVICLCAEQERILVQECGIPSEKVHRLYNWVDDRFYSPEFMSCANSSSYAFSCGREARDYDTLERAARSTPLEIRVLGSGWAPHVGFQKHADVSGRGGLRVINGNLSYRDLRTAYGAAAFTITPLHPVSYAAGVTSIVEAMAMGKAIIASDTAGISDYLKPGISGIVVRPNDPVSLANAIQKLNDDPALRAAMGSHNRKWVEEEMSSRAYAAKVAAICGAS